jgi:hypothetical protein
MLRTCGEALASSASGHGREVLADPGIVGDVRHAGERADARAVRPSRDLRQRQAHDVDQLGRLAHTLLKKLQHVGAAGDELRPPDARDARDGRLRARRRRVSEGHHGSSGAAGRGPHGVHDVGVGATAA